jgi:hypothetical protein
MYMNKYKNCVLQNLISEHIILKFYYKLVKCFYWIKKFNFYDITITVFQSTQRAIVNRSACHAWHACRRLPTRVLYDCIRTRLDSSGVELTKCSRATPRASRWFAYSYKNYFALSEGFTTDCKFLLSFRVYSALTLPIAQQPTGVLSQAPEHEVLIERSSQTRRITYR